MTVELVHGCCLEVMAAMKAAGRTVQSVVTDPPYGLHFMGAKWDAPDNIAFRAETWRLAYDLLPPGGHMAVFGGSRTHHRMACAIEDAGFEIRDMLMWLYGSGFPKSKALLKPSYEPIVLARKPGPLRALAIDACRVATDENQSRPRGTFPHSDDAWGNGRPDEVSVSHPAGRWPPNCLTDGSPEVLAAFARFGTSRSRSGGKTTKALGRMNDDAWIAKDLPRTGHDDEGSPARFYPALGYRPSELGPSDDELRLMYCAKASRAERQGSRHPTIKPAALLSWLVRLINPPGGTVLDMFSGSGTTGLACMREGFDCVLVERELEYVQMARRRLGLDFQLSDQAPLDREAAD